MEHLISTDSFDFTSVGDLSADINRMELPSGQDTFVMALADFVSDPSLSTPLTVGLYSRWGTGKSIILQRIYGECLYKLILNCKTFCKSWR